MKLRLLLASLPSLAASALLAASCTSPEPSNDAAVQADANDRDASAPADVAPVDAGTADVAGMDAGTADVARMDAGAADVAPADVPKGETSVSTTCPAGETRCGEACLATASDPLNCGACATICPDVGGGTATCTAGVCGVRCGDGRTLCGTGADATCADTMTNAANCGTCGNACAEGSACVAGACVAGCPAPRTLCGAEPAQVCTDTSSDPARCGGCDTSCPEPTGGVATCTAGVCGVRCTDGDMLCGSGASATCARVLTDVANCGACGNACPSAPRATPTCAAGVCGVVCNTGLTACEAGGATQCVDTRADSANCGACGTACPAGNACMAGACVSTCAAPRMMCGTSCLDVTSDPANCGACGTACGSYEACRSGRCERTHYRVFISSTAVTPGSLGGVAGADRFCQRLADAATLGGTWKAWVATPTSSPSSRFTRGTLPYRLLNGTQIAASYALLTAIRGLDAPIRLTEQGRAPAYTAEGTTCAVYTASYGNGEFVRYEVTRGVYGTSCDELTNSGSRAPLISLIGDYSASRTITGVPEWSYRCRFPGCHTPLGVYCFEQ